MNGITHDLEPVLSKGSPLGMPCVVADTPEAVHRDEVGVRSRARRELLIVQVLLEVSLEVCGEGRDVLVLQQRYYPCKVDRECL